MDCQSFSLLYIDIFLQVSSIILIIDFPPEFEGGLCLQGKEKELTEENYLYAY